MQVKKLTKSDECDDEYLRIMNFKKLHSLFTFTLIQMEIKPLLNIKLIFRMRRISAGCYPNTIIDYDCTFNLSLYEMGGWGYNHNSYTHLYCIYVNFSDQTLYMSDCQQSQFKKLKSSVISGRSEQSEDIQYKLLIRDCFQGAIKWCNKKGPLRSEA